MVEVADAKIRILRVCSTLSACCCANWRFSDSSSTFFHVSPYGVCPWPRRPSGHCASKFGECSIRSRGDRRHQPIGAEGEAYFSEIPSSFRNQEVPIGLESNDFELSDPKRTYRLNGAGIYVPVKKRDGRISGRVEDDNGNPLSGAKVQVGDLPPATSDSTGHFEFAIPGEQLKPELELDVVRAGYLPKRLKVVPNANDVVVQLTHAP